MIKLRTGFRSEGHRVCHRVRILVVMVLAIGVAPRYVLATGVSETDPAPQPEQEVPLFAPQPAATVGRHIRVSIRLMHPERVRDDRAGYIAGIKSLGNEIQSLSGVRYVESYWSLLPTAPNRSVESGRRDPALIPSAHFDSPDRSTTDLHVYLSSGGNAADRTQVIGTIESVVDRWAHHYHADAVTIALSRLIVPAVGLVDFGMVDHERAALNPDSDRLMIAVHLPRGQSVTSVVGAESVLDVADRLAEVPGVARVGGAADPLLAIAALGTSGGPEGGETRLNWDAPHLAGMVLPDRSGAVLELMLRGDVDLEALRHALHPLALELRRSGIVLSLFGIENIPWHWDNELAFPQVRGTFLVAAQPTSLRDTTSRVYGIDAQTGRRTVLTEVDDAPEIGMPLLRDRWLTIHNVTNATVDAVHLETNERLTFIVPRLLSGYAFFPDERSLVYSTWVDTESSRRHYLSGIGTNLPGLLQGATPVVTDAGELAFVQGSTIYLIGADGSREQLRLRSVADRIVATSEGLVAVGALPGRTITWIDHSGTRASEYRFDVFSAWRIYPLTTGAWIDTTDRTVFVYDERVGNRILEPSIVSHDEEITGVSFIAEPAVE